ncbi:SDR family NAD(P)-dependent oxidoreductase [Rhodococcus sp. IEGM 1354]|uniref:SDR family NAD(P)-dependent oxidoreductase n=1 Tax=Rhodococcus sp. IEGM 1354 TaxID=3047088 RepID=UPI0024B80EEF|nr:SDR family NAD(P)-dependent oxidoreductase [Rhodococcus sp. IEGM 1354]MDI9933654.1 SDR family NAD(P)-dependent oxidoreductase [Rhodococcus sp. IEGM 1354]
MKKYALVTGAAGGIGQVVARRLAGRDYTVLAADRDDDLAARAAHAITGAVPITCDLDNAAAVRSLRERVSAEWSSNLEIAFLNAGTIVPGNVVNADPDDIDSQLRIMLSSTVHLAQAAAQVMTRQGRGHIVATVSQGAVLPIPGSAAYSAAKAGLRAFLAALHLELRGSGVTVGGVYPSAVDTAMLRHEANHDGSLLNFVGTVSTAEHVADGVDKAIRTGRLEVFLPRTDALSVKLLQLFPRLVPVLLPLAERIGERGRLRYLASSTS